MRSHLETFTKESDMSMYNMVCGVNSLAPLLLHLINLSATDFPRIRDVYYEDGCVVVFTRTGGGNREDYQDDIDRIRAHPDFVEDWDDDFDSTYMNFKFLLPEKSKQILSEFLEDIKNHPDNEEPMKKFLKRIDSFKEAK
jgi:hypothetical protein